MLLLNWMQMMRNMHFWIKFFVVGKCFEKDNQKEQEMST